MSMVIGKATDDTAKDNTLALKKLEEAITSLDKSFDGATIVMRGKKHVE